MPSIKTIDAKINTQTEKLRVAAYCRVSSDSMDQLNSFTAQVSHYTNYIKVNPDFELVDIYADEGITGTLTQGRDEFNRMISDCKKGKIDRILVKSVSRFARNSLDCINIIRALKQLGISVHFEKEGIDTLDVTSEMMIAIPGAIATEESMSISQNMLWSCKKRMQSGTFISGNTPYGYALIDKELVVVPKQAEIVKLRFKSYLNGMGKTAIANMLNQINAPKIPAKWYTATVDYILNNERYIGDALFQKQCTTDTLPFKKMLNKGQKQKYYAENTNPPIIDKVSFYLAKEYGSRKTKPNNSSIKYPLSGIIRCDCGYFYKRIFRASKAHWVCQNHFEKALNCSSKAVSEKEIERKFIDMMNKLKSSYTEIMRPLLSQMKKLSEQNLRTNIKLYEIDKKIADWNNQLLILAKLNKSGVLDTADYTSQIDGIKQSISKYRTKRRQILNEDKDDEITTNLQILSEIGRAHV